MRRLLVCLLATCGLSSAAGAVEPWADPRLPASMRAGLIVWLDASRQPAVPVAGTPLPAWYDGSGQKRHFTQPVKDSQPTFQPSARGAAVRFDGTDDFLALGGAERPLKALTVVVVAAPFSNGGEFRGLFAGHQPGQNDYTSGVNIDLGPFLSPRWQWLNVEGPGFGGAANLLAKPVDFGRLHRLVVTADVGANGVSAYLDGTFVGRRPRSAGVIRLDQMAVGARLYSNEGRPPFARGFLDGDVAELLVYDRVLTTAERADLDKYLAEKYAGVEIVPPTRAGPPGSRPLVAVKDPPPVQMFVPGFSVRELPVDLTNVNNVKYRPDGKLVALGYNGHVYVLSDTDGDGLEDRAELFWENHGEIRAPIGMALTPPGYKLGTGVFVACKGKVSLLVDTTGRGKADREIIVAQGWKELPHGVDALGVAVDADGTVYFGLGTTDYTNAYMVKDGRATYDLKDERGTIMKVSPDFKTRQIVATGIRFPVGLAFNRHGDLFATDQEGATWLPNGNPLDELLYVQKGRHYGFPPRHPKHLPNVIDEPSTFDYGPQHQSTCGLSFNGPTPFGPAGWAGDALVTGYSRGKLYRTQLVKTPAGYVAQNQLLACLQMLAADLCVSPRGELVVACHGGAPDWGSGPTGKGKLYKITYSEPQLPQPVRVWAAGPREVRVAFDRPLDVAQLADLARQTRIEYGAYVRAGDRFETLRPGYAVVGQQMAAPRFGLPVLSAGVTADRRTLVLTTAAHPEAAHYAITLPGLGRPAKLAGKELPQHAAVDLDYDLGGVEAHWRAAVGGEEWHGWLPHLNLAASLDLLTGSADHAALRERLGRPGTLTLRTKLDLGQMLRPAVQPGSKLDYAWPPERVSLQFASNVPIRVTGIAGPVEPKEGQPVPLEVALPTGPGSPQLDVTWTTQEDARPRPLPLHRFLLPWAELKRPAEAAVREVPELKGGSWARGKAVFFGEQAQCGRCHTVNGVGGKIGPDLSNLIHRDYESVLRDIRTPSAAINPDHLAYTVELTNGKTFFGVLRHDGDRLLVGDPSGKEIPVAKADIEALSPSPVSTMPEGLDKAIGPEQLRDLLTFLLTEPLTPAKLEIPGEPPPRTRAEVEAVLKGTVPPAGPLRKIHVVLATGPKDHGPGEHDYPLWRRRWVKLFDLAENVTVSEADGWPSAAQWEKANLVVFYSNNPGWNAERAKQLDAYLGRGGGLAYIHYAVDGHRDVPALAARIGLAWQGGRSKFRHGPLDLQFPATHPITRGFGKLKLIDESYWQLAGDPKGVTVLAAGNEDGAPQPLLWAREQGKGRVFVSIPGHYTWSFDDPLFRLLLLRGFAWAAGEDVERFQPLIWPGARIAVGE